MKYVCQVRRGGKEKSETLLARQIDTINASEVLVWFTDGHERLRICDIAVTFTLVGISIRGQENTPNGWENATVHISGMVP